MMIHFSSALRRVSNTGNRLFSGMFLALFPLIEDEKIENL